MVFSGDVYGHILTLIGELTILFVLIIAVSGLILLLLTVYAIRTGKLLFPNLCVQG
jgi:uncharacterized protein